MHLNQEKKLKSRRQNRKRICLSVFSASQFVEKIRKCRRAILGYANLFFRRAIFMRLLVFILIIGWIFSGWPQIWNFPPKVQEAFAAIAIRATGAYVSATANLTPVIPAGAVAGDMMLLIYGTKPYSDVPSYPAGWVEIGSATDGTVAAGVDVGSMRTSIAWKVHTGSETNPLVTNSTNNVSGAVIIVFQKDSGQNWVTPVGAGGGDATAGTGFSVTASSDVGHTANDVLVGYAAIRSDAGAQSSITITATGLTVGTFTESPAADLITTSGGDMAMSGGYVLATAGTSSAAPVYASTLAAAHTGSAFMVRLRQVAPSAALTGTVTAAITEADIVTGGKTIILTLTNDTWVAAGATFDAQRQNIINGIDSAQAETNGWDAEVKAKEVVGAVVRTSATVVTITLTAQAGYNITATETITATIPATALVGGNAIVATPTFAITAVAGALTADIVNASYVSVGSPTMAMSNATFSFTCQTITGSFGTASQQIYVNNNNGANNGWTLTLAAQATTNIWDSVGTDYDFNDPTGSGCTDGADAGDTVGGQMTVNPSVATLAVGQCGSCTTANITKGSSAAFNEGTTNTITLLTATAASDDVGDWTLQGVSISQKVPAEQPAASDYDINMVLTVTAS